MCYSIDTKTGNTPRKKEVTQMERKKFLELCQRSAVGFGDLVFVDGVAYKPKEYVLSFDKNGSPRHSAVLVDLKSNSVNRCLLERVDSCEKK